MSKHIPHPAIHFIKKAVLIMLFMAVFVLIAAAVINITVIMSVQDRILPEDDIDKFPDGIEYILVLGAGITPDGRLTPMLSDRMSYGISLYQDGVSDKLLLSGDHSSPEYNEVGAMQNYALEHGIPESDIILDHSGFSTFDSVYRASSVFDAKKLVIVTQKYHLYRALYIASKLGIEAYGAASDPRPYIGQTYYSAREMIARVKDFFLVLLK